MVKALNEERPLSDDNLARVHDEPFTPLDDEPLQGYECLNQRLAV